MNISKFKINTGDLNIVVNYLVEHLSFDYENHCADMSILANEEFYFRNSSTQLNMIIAKKENSGISLDVIGGAGGTGILNINWWSERGYIKRVRKVLEKLAEENYLKVTDQHYN